MIHPNTCEPQIQITCSTCQRSGRYRDFWINANQSSAQIEDAIHGFLTACHHERQNAWSVHTTNYLPSDFFGKKPDLRTLTGLAGLVAEYGELALIVYDLMHDVDATCTAFEYYYRGNFDSLTEYAEQDIADFGNLSEEEKETFDYQQYGEDLEHDDEIFTVQYQDRIHVFRSF